MDAIQPGNIFSGDEFESSSVTDRPLSEFESGNNDTIETNAASPGPLDINLLPFSSALEEEPSSVEVTAALNDPQPSSSRAGLLSTSPLPDKERITVMPPPEQRSIALQS
ncbi:hypothetical protein MML48_2g00018578 [Holotrichia oblita]|uniref:Uncharacterized protein n=1 Tax=Holotrichia oblita TaxID=644536 RepID=A0ACB9TJR7_HOLOL|nr:hypothetical protein MML48_2g00018578 [Holotrichia oblita]